MHFFIYPMSSDSIVYVSVLKAVLPLVQMMDSQLFLVKHLLPGNQVVLVGRGQVVGKTWYDIFGISFNFLYIYIFGGEVINLLQHTNIINVQWLLLYVCIYIYIRRWHSIYNSNKTSSLDHTSDEHPPLLRSRILRLLREQVAAFECELVGSPAHAGAFNGGSWLAI